MKWPWSKPKPPVTVDWPAIRLEPIAPKRLSVEAPKRLSVEEECNTVTLYPPWPITSIRCTDKEHQPYRVDEAIAAANDVFLGKAAAIDFYNDAILPPPTPMKKRKRRKVNK